MFDISYKGKILTNEDFDAFVQILGLQPFLKERHSGHVR